MSSSSDVTALLSAITSKYDIDTEWEKIVGSLLGHAEGRGKSKPILWVATTWAVYVFRAKSKHPKLLNWYEWSGIYKVSLPEDNRLLLGFDLRSGAPKYDVWKREIMLKSDDAKSMFYLIHNFLAKITTPVTFPKCDTHKNGWVEYPKGAKGDPMLAFLNAVRKTPEEPNFAESCGSKELKKLNESFAAFRDFIDEPKLKKELNMIIEGKKRDVYIGLPGWARFDKGVLMMLPHLTTVDSVTFCESSGRTDAEKFIPLNRTVRKIELHCASGRDLTKSLINAFINSTKQHQNPVTSLSFSFEVSVDDDALDAIANMVKDQVTELSIASAGWAMDRFLSLCKSGRFSALTQLSLRVPSLWITGLLHSLPALKVLSIPECNVEVASVFDELTKIPNGLSKVDVSGNPCTAPIVSNLIIPPSLATLVADSIQWSGDNLMFLWNAFMRAQTMSRLNLSFKSAKMSDERWESFFASTANVASDRLDEMKWDHNPCCEWFFGAMMKCYGIAKLSIGSSLTRVGERGKTVDSLCQLISSSTTLTSFTVSVDADYKLTTEEFAKLAGAIGQNRSLKEVVLESVCSGRDLLLGLETPIMDNRVIAALSLPEIEDSEACAKVLKTWKERGVALSLAFPENAARKFSSAVKELIVAVSKGDTSIVVPPETLTRRERSTSQVHFSSGVSRPAGGALLGSENAAFVDVDDLPPGEGEAWEVRLPAIPPLNNDLIPGLFTSELAIEPMIQGLWQ